MLRLWRNAERLRKREARVSAYPYEVAGPDHHGLGSLQRLELPPGGRVPRHPHARAELVTFIQQGAVAQEDCTGLLEIIRAGEFSHTTGGPGIRWTAINASHSEWAHVFQICLGNATARVEPGCQKKRFCAADRRDKLCVVASPDGRRGSLRVHRDVLLCSAMFSRGRHVVYELPPAACAWLHVVAGEIALGDEVLPQGDGVGVTAERAVSFTAREESEVLLLHFGDPNLAFPDPAGAR